MKSIEIAEGRGKPQLPPPPPPKPKSLLVELAKNFLVGAGIDGVVADPQWSARG